MSWVVASASQRGSVHQRNGAPNQDAHRADSSASDGVAIVADGHGNQRYLRSETGARLAVETAAQILPGCLGKITAELASPSGLDLDGLEEALAQVVVTQWRSAVADHLGAHPLESMAQADAMTTYGTTLLAVAANAAHLLAFQIGDGELVLVAPDGTVTQPFAPDPTHDGVHTHSLAEADPVRAARVALIDLATHPVTLAFVVTDGFGAPQVERDWVQQVSADLLGHLRSNGIDWVREKLSTWLTEPAEVGGDDTTLALLARL